MSITNNGMKVTSNARKLIARVPETDRKVAFPVGVTISQYGKESVAPAIVVQNRTDGGSYQGAKSGQYIIVNEVTGEAANAFLATLGTTYSIETLVSALATLDASGFGDQYTTDIAFVQSKLTPAGESIGLTTDGDKIVTITAGITKRDDRDVCLVYRDASGVAQIVVKGEPRRIEDDILVRTYRNADGTEIDLTKVLTLVA